MPQVFDNTPEEQLRSVHEAFTDIIPCLSDEELETEIRERGEDPNQVAERTRQVLLSAVKAFQEKQLLAKSPGGTNPTIC